MSEHLRRPRRPDSATYFPARAPQYAAEEQEFSDARRRPIALEAAYRLEAVVLMHMAQRKDSPKERRSFLECAAWNASLAEFHAGAFR